ncbi:cytochrome P450 monooxygenase-like protein [Lindgomyces ingoldianus]|uniref:Cytochrome P450 monooxygenase-like protein n=1 Tax=Lindgomyces ingoldianus TaxID=673940 RepID=A0ACB6RFG8_9PLEO|nr:cytochrome P450 monooxygenase-like protein [Lindgomyces ingoldianus]KAF2478053.1 cytochrome P450 monooxygenase-like protein [Lindgomyces ingoldianus]
MAPSMGILPADFHLFSPTGIAFSVGAFATAVAVYALGTAIYNIYFHPLSHIPGSLSSRASGIPYTIRLRNGNVLPWIRDLHEKYGDVVRVTPTDVSFISGETAWQDIYGFRTGKHKTEAYLKDHNWFPQPINGTYSLIASDEASHSRMRRNLSHAFSDKALRDQEGLIQGFVDLLVLRLKEAIQESKPTVDIMRWYNYSTFDVIADLTFGEPLYCLRDKGYHPWVTMVFASAKAIGLMATRKKYPITDYYDRVRNMFTSNADAIQKRKEFFALSEQKVTDRLEKEVDCPDFMSYIQKNQASAEKALSRQEIDSNAVLFLIAGSETTATLLSGTTYLLLRNPDVYAKLVHDIRSKFKSYGDITIEEVNKMDYMIACLAEGLRYYPPVPTGFPRVVPRGGDRISEHYIPEGANPDAFIPERHLGAQRYANDNRAVLQPFSFGPRNCLGKNLAYAEMRLILTKVLWNFDLELVDRERDWFDQKVFTLWDKPPLMVKLKLVER